MNHFERWWADYANRFTTAGELEKAAAKAAYFEAMKQAHVAASGALKTRRIENRMYWKGRTDAANDVRRLAQ